MIVLLKWFRQIADFKYKPGMINLLSYHPRIDPQEVNGLSLLSSLNSSANDERSKEKLWNHLGGIILPHDIIESVKAYTTFIDDA